MGDQYTFEHLDFNFDEGVFADNHGCAEAFALCVPREQIVDNLIRPVVPDAEVKTSATSRRGTRATTTPTRPWPVRRPSTARRTSSAPARSSSRRTRVGTAVRLQTLNIQRRDDTGQPSSRPPATRPASTSSSPPTADFFDTSAACPRAPSTWRCSPGSAPRWSPAGSRPTLRRRVHRGGKGNNNGCYSNPEVDSSSEERPCGPPSPRSSPLVAEIERILWEDLATIPLYQHPGITAWTSQVENVVPTRARPASCGTCRSGPRT